MKKPRPKATVEEVTDSEDEGEPVHKKKVSFEMPYRDVPPVKHVPRGPVLPRKPVEPERTEADPATKDKAYTLKSVLDELSDTQKTLDRIMKTVVPIPIEDLLGGSPALQKGLKSMATKSRRVNSRAELGDVLLAKDIEREESSEEEDSSRTDGLPFATGPAVRESVITLNEDAINLADLPFDQYATILTQRKGDMPEGAVIMGDPVLQYLESLSPGEEPKQVYTAMTSAALRVVFPVINGEGSVESITDSGSQIVSMSGEEATNLGVAYDPSVRILMQSANSQIEKTLGLARNVPFRFGHITIYLQVHVIKSAPYKVLLGRPFEILTESVVRNSKDGSQTITMTDPNSGDKVTIPTRPRGFYKQAKPPRDSSTELPSEPKPDF